MSPGWRRFLVTVLIITSICFIAADQSKGKEPEIRSSNITIYGLNINQIVEQIASARLGSVPKDSKAPPLIIWLLDNSSYLIKSNETLAEAIRTEFGKYRSFQMAVVKFGAKAETILKPTDNLEIAVKTVRDISRQPDDNYKNYTEAISLCTELFKDYPHKKHLVIFTLQSDYLETDIDETLSSLKGNMTLDVISGGAIFQNHKTWSRRQGKEEAVKESANVELKDLEDWLFHFPRAENIVYFYNRYVSAGYGDYGLSRLAAYSGGKYYLYYLPHSRSQSFCQLHNCIWCTAGQSHQCTTSYSKLLPNLAPLLVSRDSFDKVYRDDPFYTYLVADWKSCVREMVPRELSTLFGNDGKNENVRPEVIKEVEYEIKKFSNEIDEVEKMLEEDKDKANLRFKMHIMVYLADLYVERFNLYQYKFYLEQFKQPKGLKGELEDNSITAVIECLCHLEEWMEISEQDKNKRDQVYLKTNIARDVNKAVKVMLKNKRMKLFGDKEGEKELTRALVGVVRTLAECRNTPWELVTRRLPVVIDFIINYEPINREEPRQPPPQNPPKSTPTPKSPPKPVPVPTPGPGPSPTPTPP